MKTLTQVRETLERIGLTPTKRRGQNFLVDQGSIRKILQFAELTSSDRVMEIGPGLGALSLDLAASCAEYFAIDIEERFIVLLREELPDVSDQRLIHSDVREIDLDDPRFVGEKLTLISNVPYSISSEVILWLVKNRGRLSRACLLLQREFAERVGAKPGGKEYGSLTVLCRLFMDAELGPRVSGSCFFPSAEVESRLIRLRVLDQPRYDVGDEKRFESLVRAAFAVRRKTLANALGSSSLFSSKAQAIEVLRAAGIDEGRRAETLSLEEYVAVNSIFRGLAVA